MTVAPEPLHGRHLPHGVPVVLGVVSVFAVLAVIVLVLARTDAFNSSSDSSGITGSGVPATQVRTVPAFGSVELAASNDVVVRVGKPQSVVVRADDNLVDRVTTQVQGGTLVIGATPGSFTTKSPMRVEVTVPSVSALKLTGSGVITATGIRASDLAVSLSGSGLLRMSGSVERLAADLAGSGDAQLERLVARDVHAVVSGSGRILVTATNSLDASVPGSGAILYRGAPAHVTTSVTGSGSVTRF